MKGQKLSPEKVEEIKALSLVYSPQVIAGKVGVSLRTVQNYLAKKDSPVIEKKREEKRLELVDKVWDDKEKDIRILKTKCDLILEGLTKEKVEKARLTELSTAFGTLFDKIRLLAGETTQNISIRSISLDLKANLDDLQRRKEEILNGENKNE